MATTFDLSKLQNGNAPVRVIKDVSIDEIMEEATVDVHGLTVREKQSITGYMVALDFGSDKMAMDALGAYATSVTINAALAARDNDGNYVFGKTAVEAIELLFSLPSSTIPAITRIFNAVKEIEGTVEDKKKG